MSGRPTAIHRATVRCLVLSAVSLACLPASAQAFQGRGCRTIKTSAYEGESVRVVVSKGTTSCAEARKIASKFNSRNPGRFHGTDLASGYWIVYGWKCQRGTDGGSGCTHGSHNRLNMQAFPPEREQEVECESERERFGKEGQSWCHETYAEKNGMTQAEYQAEAEKENHKVEEEFTAACGPPKHSTKTIEGSAEVEGWINSPGHTCPNTEGP
jgi:hypothetical protein